MNGRSDAGAAGDVPRNEFLGWLRAWRYLFWLLGIVLAITLFYVVENWRGEAAWEKYRREMAARGEPIELSAVIPPEVDDADNFAMTPFLATRFSFQPGVPQHQAAPGSGPAQGFAPRYDAAAQALDQPKEHRTVRFNSWTSEQSDLSAWCRAFQQPPVSASARSAAAVAAIQRRYGLKSPAAGPARPAAPAQGRGATGADSGAEKPGTAAGMGLREAASGVLAGLEECRPVFEELRSASRRPRSRFKIDYTGANPAEILLPHLATLKQLSQVLKLRASAELALGRTDEAFDDVMLMLDLSEASREEPMLISHLVRIAQFHLAIQPLAEGLAGHQWSEAQLRRLEDRLGRLDFCADARRALHGERVLCGCGVIDFVRRSRGGSPWETDSGPSKLLAEVLLRIAPSGWFDLEELNLCRDFDGGVLAGIDVPGRQIHPAGMDVRRDDESGLREGHPESYLILSHRFFAALFVPGMAGAAQRPAYAQTAADLAAIACALELWRLAHGQFPETLDSLVPGFIDQLPHDIINGQPLKYHRTAEGRFVLYSVGWNQTDDGGTVGLTADGKRVDPRTGDWVWGGG
jgi:hypothetical protein